MTTLQNTSLCENKHLPGYTDQVIEEPTPPSLGEQWCRNQHCYRIPTKQATSYTSRGTLPVVTAQYSVVKVIYEVETG